MNDLERAHDSADRAVAFWHELPNSETNRTRDVAESFNILGCILDELDDHEGAVVALRRALGLRSKVSPEEGPLGLVAASLLNIGEVLSHMGRWKEARHYALDSVQTYRASLEAEGRGGARIGLTRALMNLGEAQWMLGEMNEAIGSNREAVLLALAFTEYTPAYGKDLRTALGNYRMRLQVLGRLNEADAATWEAIDVWRRVSNDRGLASAKDNLNYFLRQMKGHEQLHHQLRPSDNG